MFAQAYVTNVNYYTVQNINMEEKPSQYLKIRMSV